METEDAGVSELVWVGGSGGFLAVQAVRIREQITRVPIILLFIGMKNKLICELFFGFDIEKFSTQSLAPDFFGNDKIGNDGDKPNYQPFIIETESHFSPLKPRKNPGSAKNTGQKVNNGGEYVLHSY